jgi:hypothetical protein
MPLILGYNGAGFPADTGDQFYRLAEVDFKNDLIFHDPVAQSVGLLPAF